MGTFIDLTDKRFGKLTVIGIANKENGKIKWKCQCDCGETVIVAGNNLKNGHTKSCGCTKHNTPSNAIDLQGKRFGRLVVKGKGNGRFTKGGQYKATWICDCDCGTRGVEVDGAKLRNGHTKSCGCLVAEHIKDVNWEDLTNKRFGRLTVIRYLDKDERTTTGYNWWCRCDCGNEIKANATKLKEGLQQSCGCLKEEMKPRLGEITRKYTHSNKRLYSVYNGMMSRCYSEKHREYHNYGGRGIRVCEEWLGEYGYDVFAEWALKTGYDKDAKYGECTLDRMDVDGMYSPDNCRWITNAEQQNNKRGCIKLEYDGEIHTVSEWARILHTTRAAVNYHCVKNGHSIGELKEYIGL